MRLSRLLPTVFIFFGVCLGLVVLELSLRAFQVAPPTISEVVGASKVIDGTPMGSDPRTFDNESRPDIGRDDPIDDSMYVETVDGARLRPNTTVRIRRHFIGGNDVTVHTNSLGFRGPEIGEKTMRRLLFLGDSVTMEDFKFDADTWTRRVERRFAESGQPWQVINGGIGGTSLRNYFELLKERGIGIKPDLVFVGLYLNDFHPSLYYKPHHVPRFLNRSWVVQHLINRWGMQFGAIGSTSDRVPEHVTDRWRAEVDERFLELEEDREGMVEFKQQVLRDIDSWGGTWHEGSWDIMRPILRDMRDYLSVHNIPLLLGIFPEREQVLANGNFDYPQRRFNQITEELGLPAPLNLLPSIVAAWRESKDPPLFYDGCHLSIRGGEIVADQVYEYIHLHSGDIQ
jgi:hypothetical protein